MITALSTPNIALIKYWGNRNEELRLPAADSLSMTLDSPSVEIQMDHADQFIVRSFLPDGSEKHLTEKDTARFQKHLALMNAYLHITDELVSITIRSHIPSGIGIASSAAVFSCLAQAYAALRRDNLSDEEISILARLGSGSAARSIMGGFVALNAETGAATQIADEHHWTLHDIIIVPSHDEKKVGSTEGHALAGTSPLFADRLKAIPRRMRECMDAILQRDFEKLRAVSEEDALDMHHVMETSNPPLKYLSDETHRILKDITTERQGKHLPVLYTMDAGPTVHLICEEEAVNSVKEFAHSQNGCTVFEAKVGRGAHIMSS